MQGLPCHARASLPSKPLPTSSRAKVCAVVTQATKSRKAAWTGPPEFLKDTLISYMATALREPESQLGRGNKKKP
jgi:hypothetical protein